MDIDKKRKQLLKLNKEQLVDALLDLAMRSDKAYAVAERLASPSKDNAKRYKQKLAGLKRGRRFIDYNEAYNFSTELSEMLDDLTAGVADPKTGVELMVSFIMMDKRIFERCDDSDGFIGDVFRNNAPDVFIQYASQCEDKKCLCDQLMPLIEDDEYGTRSAMLDSAASFLPTDSMRALAERLWDEVEKSPKDDKRYDSRLVGVRMLACQLGDPVLFERAELKRFAGNFPIISYMKIANEYLKAGNPGTALSWMKKASDCPSQFIGDYNKLMLKVHKALGDTEKAEKTAWTILKNHRSSENLDGLLEIIGHDKREEVLSKQAQAMLNNTLFSLTDALFFIKNNMHKDAEGYLLKHAENIDGDKYYSLLPMAQELEREGKVLGAIVIYRSLIESTLRRRASKYYYHGVKYLRKLDKISPDVIDWKTLPQHDEYKELLLKMHSKKRSFWTRYEEAG